MTTCHKLYIIGRTPDGRPVVAGVWGFFETHGLPLTDILYALQRYGSVVALAALYRDGVAAGVSPERMRGRIIEATVDVYGAKCAESIRNSLRVLAGE